MNLQPPPPARRPRPRWPVAAVLTAIILSALSAIAWSATEAEFDARVTAVTSVEEP